MARTPGSKNILKQSDDERSAWKKLLRRLKLSEDETEIPTRGPDTFQAGFHITREERDWLRARAQARGISAAHYLLTVFRAHHKAIGDDI